MTREIAKTFGRFHILGEPLVRHETTVYRAYDPAQDRQLALTIIPVRPASAGGDPKSVLQRALKLLELKHPHIVKIEAAGLEGDYLYLESPLIEATSLADHLSRKPLGVPEAARYFEQIVSALDLAHSRGVFHLAVRPEHILLDGYGNALLINFGLALMEPGLMGQIHHNELHRAPEQGRGAEADGRVDQYALGALLFRMLTGYTTSSPGMPVSELIRRMHERTARLATGPTPIPGAIVPVIVKATSWDPSDRFRTIREMRDAFQLAAASVLETRTRLRAEKAGSGIDAAVAQPTGLPFSQPSNRRRWLPLAALLVGLAFVLGGYAFVSAGGLNSLRNAAVGTQAVPNGGAIQLTEMAGTIEALTTRINGSAFSETSLPAVSQSPTGDSLLATVSTAPINSTGAVSMFDSTSTPTAPAVQTPMPGPTQTSDPGNGGATQLPPGGTSPPPVPSNTSPAPTGPPAFTNTPRPASPTPPAPTNTGLSPTNTSPPPTNTAPPPTNTSPPPTNPPPPPTNTPILPLPTVTLPFP